MITFELTQSQENLTIHSGLALVGMALRPTQLDNKINQFRLPAITGTPEISHSDVIRSYVGLLCQGKHAFEAIEDFRGEEPFFWSGIRGQAGAFECYLAATVKSIRTNGTIGSVVNPPKRRKRGDA